MDKFIERLDYLLKLNETNAKTVTSDLRISTSTFTDWRKGKGKPSLETSVKLAHYFNVSLDWLVDGEDMSTYSDAESQLHAIFTLLSPELQQNLLIYSKGLLDASNSLKGI